MSKKVRAIGIDPGIANTGLAVIHWDRQRYALKHCRDRSRPHAKSWITRARVTLICEKVLGCDPNFQARSVVYRGRVFQQKTSHQQFQPRS